jgi:hypothetical protein
MASGNDAANVVARETAAITDDSPWQALQRFLDRANARVGELGMHDTHLVNPHGLDEVGHVSTARDLAAIGLHIARTLPGLIEMAGAPEWSGEGHVLVNTNELIGRYPGLLAGKTGFTEDAGYCLIEIARRGIARLSRLCLAAHQMPGTRMPCSYSTLASGAGRLRCRCAVRCDYCSPDDRAGQCTSALSSARNGDASPISDNGDVVRTNQDSRDRQWRAFVALCVGFACLTLGAGSDVRPAFDAFLPDRWSSAHDSGD